MSGIKVSIKTVKKAGNITVREKSDISKRIKECDKPGAERISVKKTVTMRTAPEKTGAVVRKLAFDPARKISTAPEKTDTIAFGQSERAYLEKKLSDAESNLRHAEKKLAKLLTDKANGWKGLDTFISENKYKIRSYSSEIQRLRRDIARIKD